MKFTANDLLLYVVTDRTWLGTKPLADAVEAAILGGTTLIQLREKTMSHENFLQEAIRLKKICDQHQVPLIINDNVDVAMASQAHGVHLGQSDGGPGKARKHLGENKIIGVSVRTLEQALRAQEEGADYLGVGAVFETSTKTDAESVSHEVLREICRAVNIPVVAIGGINRSNAQTLKGTGIHGIAVISDLFSHDNIEEAARTLKSVARQITDGEITG